MGTIPTATRLTKNHGASQDAIRAEFAAAAADAWSTLDPSRLDRTTPMWLTVVEAIVRRLRRASAAAAADYYQAHRDAELEHLGRDSQTERWLRWLPGLAAEAGVIDERLRRSLLVTGPGVVRAASASGRGLDDAAAAGLARSTAAASRHIAGGGRDLIHHAADRDPAVVGYARVLRSPRPCWLCALQAARGPIFNTEASALLAREKTPAYAAYVRGGRHGDVMRAANRFTGRHSVYHDDCRCDVKAVYDASAPWPDGSRDAAGLWKTATKGLRGADARRAFRRAIDARNRS